MRFLGVLRETGVLEGEPEELTVLLLAEGDHVTKKLFVFIGEGVDLGFGGDSGEEAEEGDLHFVRFDSLFVAVDREILSSSQLHSNNLISTYTNRIELLRLHIILLFHIQTRHKIISIPIRQHPEHSIRILSKQLPFL